MRSKEKKFGVLIVESDGASSKERENSRNGEDGIKGCSINVGVLSDPTGRVLSGNWDMYPEGRPEGALPLLGMRESFGVRARTCRRRVLWTSGRRLRRVGRLC